MDYKQAATILIKLLESPKLDKEEKEAISMAIGMLSWASLSKSNIQKLKDKKARDIQ